ncbi:MAG: hypothetical protein EXR50_07280 [Dehalococcoidia bacterium]|nr:hypothetical protein [Dehalococcoidia bacterium]
MAAAMSAEDISAKVAQAMERARHEFAPSERLIPFTEAQIKYIQGFVAFAIADVLTQSMGKP